MDKWKAYISDIVFPTENIPYSENVAGVLHRDNIQITHDRL
jgi:hypothetical protein